MFGGWGRAQQRVVKSCRVRRRSGHGAIKSRVLQGESLEIRCVLEGSAFVVDPGAQIRALEGISNLSDATGGSCSVSDREALDAVYRLPAPISADFNLDGEFTTDDFLTYFQETDLQAVFGLDAFGVHAVFDIARTMQLAPYEVEAALTLPAPCLLLQLTSVASGSNITQEITYYADGQTPKELVSRFGSSNESHFETTVEFDASGHVESTSLNIYMANSNHAYSRSVTEYDDDGMLLNYSTLVYSGSGDLRRSTYTWVAPDDSVFQATEARYFQPGQVEALREIHYYDRLGDELGRKTYRFDQGELTGMLLQVDTGSLRIRTEFAAVNSLLPPPTGGDFINEVPKDNTPPTNTEALAYLNRLHAEYREAYGQAKSRYGEIARMNVPASFSQLNALIESNQLPAAETARLRNLRLYFLVMKDLNQAIQSGNLEWLRQRYTNVIDSQTGHWKASFVRFMQAEKLEFPLEPLRLYDSPSSWSSDTATLLANAYRATIGEDAADYFHSIQEWPRTNTRRILESMRRAKVEIRLLELQSEDGPPMFDRISVPDRPDMSQYGFTKIVTLTGWYFFERREDGTYIRDDVDIDVMRQRFAETERDEDTFYVMNLEDWPLDGTPEERAASLVKLQRAADLIHEFNPNLMIGYYRLMPLRNVQAVLHGEGSEAYNRWQSLNTEISRTLERSADLIFPSLYVLHLGNRETTTEEFWSNYARENIEEAKRIANGKPVFAFLALYYHPNGGLDNPVSPNPKGWEWVEPQLLTYQLLSLQEHVDGMVLYNDLWTTWDSLRSAGVVSALELVNRVRQLGKVDEYLTYYDQVLSEHESDLTRKIDLETLIYNLNLDEQAARLAGNSALAARLRQQITAADAELSNAFTPWPLLQQFARNLR